MKPKIILVTFGDIESPLMFEPEEFDTQEQARERIKEMDKSYNPAGSGWVLYEAISKETGSFTEKRY